MVEIDSVKLTILQKQKGLTGKQLAEKAGIYPETLSKIKKTEKCTPMTARMLAHFLSVDSKEIQK